MHVLIVQLSLLMGAVTLAAAQVPRPVTCSDHCGDVEIPYPFGIEPQCYMEVQGQDEKQFKVTCDNTTSPPSLKFLNGDIFPASIANISVGESELHVMVTTSRNCYTNNSYNSSRYRASTLDLPSSYTISDKNTVFIVGCNKISLYQGFVSQVARPTEIEKLGASGVSLCQDLLGGQLSNNCSGFGCTQNSILSGLHNITLDVWTIGMGLGSTSQWGLDYPCSYGFIVDGRNFTFAGNASFMELTSTARQELPVVVNWEIGNENCDAATKNQTSYACKAANTECVNRIAGYYCKCHSGYQGNPYILGGCQGKKVLGHLALLFIYYEKRLCPLNFTYICT